MKKPAWEETWIDHWDDDLPWIEMGGGVDFVLPDTERRRLVVAAPDMYRALAHIEQCLSTHDKNPNHASCIKWAQAAMKKARGE